MPATQSTGPAPRRKHQQQKTHLVGLLLAAVAAIWLVATVVHWLLARADHFAGAGRVRPHLAATDRPGQSRPVTPEAVLACFGGPRRHLSEEEASGT